MDSRVGNVAKQFYVQDHPEYISHKRVSKATATCRLQMCGMHLNENTMIHIERKNISIKKMHKILHVHICCLVEWVIRGIKPQHFNIVH